MAIYVDSPIYRLGRMHMCHMLADTTEELLAMAAAIGVAHKHLQYPGAYNEHFDICKSKRVKAVKLGAIEVTGQQLGRILFDRRRA